MSDQAFPPGQYPPMPGDLSYGAAPQRTAPSQVLTAVKLMFARAALAVLSVVALVATKDTLRQQVRDNNPGFSKSQLDTAVTAGIVGGVIFAIIFALLYVLLALQVRQGKSWARIVTIVLAALGLLSGLYGLLRTAPALTKVVSVIDLVLDIGILVLLIAPASAEYFRRRA